MPVYRSRTCKQNGQDWPDHVTAVLRPHRPCDLGSVEPESGRSFGQLPSECFWWDAVVRLSGETTAVRVIEHRPGASR